MLGNQGLWWLLLATLQSWVWLPEDLSTFQSTQSGSLWPAKRTISERYPSIFSSIFRYMQRIQWSSPYQWGPILKLGQSYLHSCVRLEPLLTPAQAGKSHLPSFPQPCLCWKTPSKNMSQFCILGSCHNLLPRCCQPPKSPPKCSALDHTLTLHHPLPTKPPCPNQGALLPQPCSLALMNLPRSIT